MNKKLRNLVCPYPLEKNRDKVYDPFTLQRNPNGTYTCGVKGGHCIDIAYYDPGPPDLYEKNTTYCHSRSCAKMVKRFRGCVPSDSFIQNVYLSNKGINITDNSTESAEGFFHFFINRFLIDKIFIQPSNWFETLIHIIQSQSQIVMGHMAHRPSSMARTLYTMNGLNGEYRMYHSKEE